MKSFLSRAVVAGALLTSAAGWVGVHLEPAAQAQAATDQAGATTTVSLLTVRDRAAWQPSPVPSTGSAFASSAPAAAVPVAAAPAAPAAPVVSAPPPTGIPSFATALTDWLRRMVGLSGRPAQPATNIEPVPGVDTVIPMSSLYNQDALEAAWHGALPATRGEWREISFFSRSLGRDVSYLAWLPPGYATSGKTYPSLYLLHGVGSSEAYGVEEWLGYALTEDLDRMLAMGTIEPMIVILPNGEQGYWINQANGGPQWADFVAKDLLNNVDATFRTIATRETRAIGGLSMGGHGAVQIAYNHPELFSVAGAHSPTIRPFETSPEFFGDQAHFAQYDPVSLAKNTKNAQRILTWIDVGADDKWRSGAESLAAVLTAQHAPLQFRVIEGEHEGWYWRYYLPEYLYFYSNALHTTEKSSTGAPVVESQLLTAAGAPSSGL